MAAASSNMAAADQAPGGYPWHRQTYLDRLTALGEENPFDMVPRGPADGPTAVEPALSITQYLDALQAYTPDAVGPRDPGGAGYLERYYQDFPEAGPHNTFGITYIALDPPSFECWQRQLAWEFDMDQNALDSMRSLCTMNHDHAEPEYLRVLQFLIKDRPEPLRDISSFSKKIVIECISAMTNPDEWNYQDPEGHKGYKGKGKGKLHEVPGPRPLLEPAWQKGGYRSWDDYNQGGKGAWGLGWTAHTWQDWGHHGQGRDGHAQGGWRR